MEAIPVLPVLDPAAVPAGRLVERAVTVVMVLFGLLIAGVLVTASTASMYRTVAAPGELEPRVVWRVRPREAGLVASVAVRSGQSVRAGDLLFRIDSVPLAATAHDLETKLREAALDARRAAEVRPLDILMAGEGEQLAEAALVRARARMLATLVDYRTSTNVDSIVHASGGAEHVAIDLVRADVQQAEAELRLARLKRERLQADSLEAVSGQLLVRQLAAQLALVRQRLGELEVRAPAAGIVLTDGIERIAGRMVGEGESVMELGAVDGWHVQLLVADADIHHLKPGQEVQIDFTSAGTERPAPLIATVATVATEPWRPDPTSLGGPQRIDPAPRYRVVATLPTIPDSLAPFFRRGSTVEASVRIGREHIATILLDRLFGRQQGAG